MPRWKRPELRLEYPHKRSRRQILAGVEAAALRIQATWGVARPDGWRNRLIHSDNLRAMRALLDDPDVAGHVTLAYLDPPFATDQQFRSGVARTSTISASKGDRLAYDDRWATTEYVEFLRQRLVLLRELLGENGSLYVHIGSQMSHYVRVLLDEVFGREQFLSEIARVKCNPKNFRRRAYGNVKDTILFYSKAGRHVWNDSREPMTDAEIERLFPRCDGKGRRYTTTPLHAPGETAKGATGALWKGLPPPRGRHWRVDPKELSRLDRAGAIEWSSSGNPRKKIYADDIERAGKKRQDIWSFKDPQYPTYPTEKNLEMLESIVLASSGPGDLVLDCFAGSGTTLLAAEKHSRRWIGIDQSHVAIQRARRRLIAVRECRQFSLLTAGRART
jgi:adenine-specific DNA-methyltransferase